MRPGFSGLAPDLRAFSLSNAESWYEIRAQAAAAEPVDVYVFDEIGAYGVSALAFVSAIRGIKSKALNVHLNSPGGDAFDGIAIFNALTQHPAAVTVYVDGLAASAASIVAMAGERRMMCPGSALMIHEPYVRAEGNSSTLERASDFLNKLGDNIASIYAGRAGGDVAEWRALMRAETWYKPHEAVEAKLADEVGPNASAKAHIGRALNLAGFNVPAWYATGANRPANRTSRAMRRLIRNAAQLSPDELEQIDNLLDSIESNADAIHQTVDAIEALLGIEDEPDEAENRARNAEWDTQYINNLPDSAFAYVAPGGKKDDGGKTVPRSLRYLPHHSAGGAVDMPHLRNALSRAPQTNLPPAAKAAAIRHLQAHAQSEGMGESAA